MLKKGCEGSYKYDKITAVRIVFLRIVKEMK